MPLAVVVTLLALTLAAVALIWDRRLGKRLAPEVRAKRQAESRKMGRTLAILGLAFLLLALLIGIVGNLLDPAS